MAFYFILFVLLIESTESESVHGCIVIVAQLALIVCQADVVCALKLSNAVNYEVKELSLFVNIAVVGYNQCR